MISYKAYYDRLLILIDTTPGALYFLQTGHGLSQKGSHTYAQVAISLAAAAIATAHPDDIPDVNMLRDVLAAHFIQPAMYDPANL